jgi:hypothetical protein
VSTPKPIEPELKRGVRPQERPDRHCEKDPRRSPKERGRPAIANERADGEGKRRQRRGDEWAANAVHLPERLARHLAQHLRRFGVERRDALSDVRSTKQRDDHREAQRRVVDDDDDAALLPDSAAFSRVEQQVGTGVQPGTSAYLPIQSARGPGR